MRASPDVIKFIKKEEGLRTKAYWDNGMFAIGYGHRAPNIKQGDVITEAEADRLFAKDLKRFEECVNRLIQVELTQNQFDSLVSFAYNVGCGALRRSTLRRIINQKRYNEAPKEMMRWRKPIEILGRRRREVAMWKGNMVTERAKKMKKVAVVVGHNARSQGAVILHGKLKGTSEYVWNGEVAKIMKELAHEYNLEAKIFYRSSKLGYSRQISRVYRAADKWGADLTVELHFNGAPTEKVRYSVTLSSGSRRSLEFARLIQAATVRAFNRKAHQDKGIITRSRAERGGWSLHAGRAPAVLTEPFFGTNAQDSALAAQPGIKEVYARELLGACAEMVGELPRARLRDSRTMQAGVGLSGPSAMANMVMGVVEDLGYVSHYSEYIQIGLAGLTLLGVGIMLYARYDDWKNGKR